jgi:hypothetical protein
VVNLPESSLIRFVLTRNLWFRVFLSAPLLALPLSGEWQHPVQAQPLAWQLQKAPGAAPVPTDVTQPLGPPPSSRLIPIDAPLPASPGSAGSGAAGAQAPEGSAPTIPLFPGTTSPEAYAQLPLPPLMSSPLNAGMPTGYVGRWGDYYLAGSAGTPGKQRTGDPDGSLALGFGLGDPINLVGIDLSWGIGSVRNFGANGGFNASVGRVLVNQPRLSLSVAGGVINAFAYGTEFDNGLEAPSNGYGAVSATIPLRPFDVNFRQLVQLSAGVGGNLFAPLNQRYEGPTVGGFVSAGVELSPNLGASLAVSGRGTNLSLGWAPSRRLPVFVSLLAADVFSATPYGTVGVLTIGWSDNFLTGFLNR